MLLATAAPPAVPSPTACPTAEHLTGGHCRCPSRRVELGRGTPRLLAATWHVGPGDGGGRGASCHAGAGRGGRAPRCPSSAHGTARLPRCFPPMGSGRGIGASAWPQRGPPQTRPCSILQPQRSARAPQEEAAAHRDEQIPLVVALQRHQLAGCQQGQAQLPHGQGSHLGHRALQDSLPASDI